MPDVAPPRLLLVEDDATLRDAMAAALDGAGYAVCSLEDGRDVESWLESFHPDMALLDIGLPGGPDGFEVAARLRAATNIPLLFVTAADGLGDRLRGFEVGADDYLVKPFAIAELLVRIRAVLRRAGRLTSPTFEVRDIVIDEGTRTVTRAGHDVEVTKTEFDLLCVLARSAGRVLSKAQLLSRVWGFEEYAPNLVEVHVSSLRRKLEMFGPRIIETERGEGYVVRS